MEWGSHPLTRAYHTAQVSKDRMIVFGGISSNKTLYNDVGCFNLLEMEWEFSELAPTSQEEPTARAGKKG